LSFDNPGVLGFLFALIVIAVFIVIRYRRSREKVALFAAAAPSNERESMLRELRLRLIISDIFFLLFTGFLVIALAGPRWGQRMVADYRRGVDVILAFDLSHSMNVSDCFSGQYNISRLERGLDIARELAVSLGDVRLGAAIGREKGVLAVPLTYDAETVFYFLHGLDTAAITGRGTNLESLVDAALASFQDSVPSRRGIILFSDGETLSGSYQGAVERARRAGVSLSAVGLGSYEGGPVPSAQYEGFLLTEDGEPVFSTRQEDLLRFGADRTGGIYVDGNRKDAAGILSGHINSLGSESRLSGYRREANPRWQIFIFAAMACLAGSRLMGYSRRKKRHRDSIDMRPGKETAKPVRNTSLLSILLLVFLLGSCSKVQGKLLIMEGNFFNARGLYTEAISSYLKAHEYEAPYAEYGLGSAYFALEEGAAALERYKAAMKGIEELNPEHHTELRYRIHYNTGIICFENGDYEEAAGAFRDALKVDASRIEAKRNLELSLLTIARSSAPKTASSQEGAESIRESSAVSSSVLFEYLREREQEKWKSREWNEESSFTGPDY